MYNKNLANLENQVYKNDNTLPPYLPIIVLMFCLNDFRETGRTNSRGGTQFPIYQMCADNCFVYRRYTYLQNKVYCV